MSGSSVLEGVAVTSAADLPRDIGLPPGAAEPAPRSLGDLLHGSTRAWIVLLVSLLLTAAAWYFSSEHIERRLQDRFAFRVDALEDAIKERMLAYEQVMRGASGLFAASDHVTRHEWRTYVDGLRLDELYPGIQGLGVSVPVPADQLAAHEHAVRAEGFPDYRIRPETPREHYHAIIYLEPFDWRNRRAFGFDMWSNAVRRKAMRRAIETGRPAMSAMVTLVQETDTDVQKGFLFYLPMYRAGPPLSTAAERSAAFERFVYGAFRVEDLMRGILGRGEPDVRFVLYDEGRIEPGQVLYSSRTTREGEATGESPLRTTVPIDIAGHRWTMAVQAEPSFTSTGEHRQSMIVGFGGLVVDVLLFLIINSIARQRRQAVEIANAMARDLKREKRLHNSQQHLNAIFDGAPDAIVSASSEGCITHWNQRATTMFGHPPETAIGSPVEFLLAEESVETFRRMCGSAGSFVDDASVELSARHADGAPIPVEVSLTRWSADDQSFLVLVLRDITERRRLERIQAEHTAELEQTNRELDEFAYVASHDLMAPLRAVDNLASWIEDDAAAYLPEKSRTHLQRLRARVGRMEKLLTDLLAYSRAGRTEEDVSACTMPAIVGEVVGLLSPPAAFVVSCEGYAEEFRTHCTPLRQVLQNLVGNAIKHHDRDAGEVVVAVERVPESRLRVVVSDDGPGIEPADHERAFKMFQTLRSRDEVEGSGMGLAMVKKLVESMGSTVTMESTLGQGTRIAFEWPVETVPPTAHPWPSTPAALGA